MKPNEIITKTNLKTYFAMIFLIVIFCVTSFFAAHANAETYRARLADVQGVPLFISVEGFLQDNLSETDKTYLEWQIYAVKKAFSNLDVQKKIGELNLTFIYIELKNRGLIDTDSTVGVNQNFETIEHFFTFEHRYQDSNQLDILNIRDVSENGAFVRNISAEKIRNTILNAKINSLQELKR